MKTHLRICVALLLAIVVQGYSFAQTVSTTLGSLTGVKTGITRDFTVTTQGSGQAVRGKFTFSPYVANDIILQYQAPGSDQYVNLTVGSDGVVLFGPFTLTPDNATHNFKILFNRGDTYGYTLGLVDASNTATSVGSPTTGTVAVTTFQEPTINGTLDIIDQQEPGVETGRDVEWQILVEAKDRAGDKANIEIVLSNPDQRNNFTLLYDVRRAIMNGGEPDFQPLTFNANGVAKIGPEGGETLVAVGDETTPDINQIFRMNFSQPGTYTYTINLRRIDGNVLASVEETITVTGVAGIDDMIGNSRVSVYPTLANGTVRVDLGNVRDASISVTDMLGRVVMQLNNATGAVELNTNSMAKGTYFVKVIKGNDVAGSRFIVR